MTEQQISSLIAQRHKDDVWVPQCKNGPTYSASPGTLLRLDGVAVARSWAHPSVTIYEIKTSRSDFLRDTKWRCAMELCNEFYWVAPDKVIDKSEVPEECGLITVSSMGTRLFTRKRAPYREIAPPVQLFRYILTCRTRVLDDVADIDRAEQWRRWLEKRDEDKEIGHAASRKLSRLYNERIVKVREENMELRAELKKFDDIARYLMEIGAVRQCSSERGVYYKMIPYGTHERIDRARQLVPRSLISSMRSVLSGLESFIEERTEVTKAD